MAATPARMIGGKLSSSVPALRSCRSRFSSVSSGTQTSSSGSPDEKTVPNCETWTDTFSHLSCTSSLDLLRDCDNCGTWAGTSSRPSLPSTPHQQSSGRRPVHRGTNSPSRPAPRLAPCVPRHVRISRHVSRPCVASWKAILPTEKPTSPRVPRSTSSPVPCTTPAPYVLRSVPCLASLDLCYAVQPALRLTSHIALTQIRLSDPHPLKDKALSFKI
jgi:hypothetical protein